MFISTQNTAHDKIKRFEIPKTLQGPPSCNITGYFPLLYAAFSRFGVGSQGYAFVEFVERAEAEQAQLYLDGGQVRVRAIKHRKMDNIEGKISE